MRGMSRRATEAPVGRRRGVAPTRRTPAVSRGTSAVGMDGARSHALRAWARSTAERRYWSPFTVATAAPPRRQPTPTHFRRLGRGPPEQEAARQQQGAGEQQDAGRGGGRVGRAHARGERVQVGAEGER